MIRKLLLVQGTNRPAYTVTVDDGQAPIPTRPATARPPATDAERLAFLEERLKVAPADLREVIADSIAAIKNSGQTGAARLEEIYEIEHTAGR